MVLQLLVAFGRLSAKSFPRRSLLGILLLLAVGWMASAVQAEGPAAEGPAAGNSQATSAASEHVDNYARKLRLEAEIEVYSKASSRLETAALAALQDGNVLEGLQTLDEEAGQVLADVLKRNARPAVTALTQAADDLERHEKTLRDEWCSTRAALEDKRQELFELKGDSHVAGQMASLLSVNKRSFWLFGVVAIIVLVAIVCHDRRHELRRSRYGGKAREMKLWILANLLLIALIVVTVALFLFQDRIYLALLAAGSGEQTPRAQIRQENQSLEEELAGLEATEEQAEQQYSEALKAFQPMIRGGPPRDPPLLEQWKKGHDQIRRIAVGLGVQNGMAGQLATQTASLVQLQEDVEAVGRATASCNRVQHWIRGGLGFVLLGLAVAGGELFLRGLRRRQQRTHDTCPVCLSVGKFKPLATDEVRCTNLISTDPRETCGFKCLSLYRDMVKLCFPTLGATSAGKTHYMTEVYSQLKRGDYPDDLQFGLVDTPMAGRFDGIEARIHDEKRPPESTQPGEFAIPLVFKFKDRDRLGKSDILLNFFDYSGEVTLKQTLESPQRRRALDADGYLFFLDPLRSSRDQSRAIHRFSEDLGRIRKLKPGRLLHSPVAICVTKIDLLVNMPYADPEGGGMVGEFYRQLRDVGSQLDLPSIRRRSQVFRRIRDTVWPGWKIEKQVRGLFGKRFMYFPLTPVGLGELGEEKLSNRTIAPYGLLAPVLWLLHMNGYPVFV